MTKTQYWTGDKFENTIGINFQLYNSLFLSLPFHGIEKTGTLLTLFNQTCSKGYENEKSPVEILDDFFSTNTSLEIETERLNLLFHFVQYAERQVVLFDALEDAFFDALHDMNGPGSMAHLHRKILLTDTQAELAKKIQDFSVKLVLTAHPTQFYTGSVLGIINDLTDAIKNNDAGEIKTLLQQLGRTPFFKKQKPTPLDEAISLIWYLENVFYSAIGEIAAKLKSAFPDENINTQNFVKMGFWSGGDRDGNPFVKVDTTLKVADALRAAILRSYYSDIRKIRRRLTFSGIDSKLLDLERSLYQAAFQDFDGPHLTKTDILQSLFNIRALIYERHDGLFAGLVDDLICKVEIFGLHFASLDIRQDSSVHKLIYKEIAKKPGILPVDYQSLSEDEKIEAVLKIETGINTADFENELAKDTFENIKAVKRIQETNGERGCNRYIISNSQKALNVIEAYGLFLMGGWKREELTFDIAPLFETVEDLRNAADIMKKLYRNNTYRDHLRRRGDTQTIMLGFSDGTKDGGYLMANYGIYRAKDELTKASRKFGINVIFFDGRGGPPARGGGKTHKFYSSMGKNISDKAIELTIQGQTVSSNFGTVDSAKYNIEQLLSAGIYNSVFTENDLTFTKDEEALIKKLAESSFMAYADLKNDPVFLDYLENVSPLKYFARTNIGSRPTKRGGAADKLTLSSLRAIPFVGAWSQIKQNVPGFYGVGIALDKINMEGKLSDVATLYKNNIFFKTLIDNSEMSMQKMFFPLTRHLKDDPVYGKFWKKIKNEYELTQKHLAVVTEKDTCMTDFPIARQSIRMREKIVLPLTTIQQYALTRLRESDTELNETYEKLVIRCSFGIINAGRNSA